MEAEQILSFSDQDSFAAFRRAKHTEKELVYGKITKQKGFALHSFDGNTSQFIGSSISPFNTDFRMVIHRDWTSKATSFKEYERGFNECQNLINNGKAEKLVLSRTLWIESKENAQNIYQKLCALYPTTLCFLYNTPEIGCWIGATPEILIQKSSDAYLSMSLAGTKKLNDRTEWGDKEKEEQNIVTRYIENKLMRGGHQYHKGTLEELNTGVVRHLLTRFKLYSTSNIIDLALSLHPTPAVAGTPYDVALKHIPLIEKHKRDMYCGYIGPISPSDKATLYVQLRCAQVFSNGLLLYLGGGITSNSDLHLEWEETELKAQTILKALSHKL